MNLNKIKDLKPKAPRFPLFLNRLNRQGFAKII